MLSGRSGGDWFLEWTRISFYSFFSLDKTSQILALQKSWPAGTGIPRDLKKELCNFE
jgi:hypothetical protein